MSALQLPPDPSARTPRPAGRHLRLVEVPASALAPSGPLQAWRRRIGAMVVLAALVVVLGQAFVGAAPDTGPVTVPASAATVVVQPGQTLWDIASANAPADTSTWAYIDELAELNGVEGAQLDAWQVLRLPAA